jgi:guanylate kinase
MKPTIVVLTGPTCAGKSTLEKKLQDRGFARLTSVTTRQPRVEEINGVHYKFVDKPTFDYMSANDDLIERIEYEGNFYGIEATEVSNAASQGKPVVVVVEPNGRDQIVKFAQKHDWNVVTVFVDNPFSVIAKRFVERYTSDIVMAGRNIDSVMKRYTNRITSMLSTEAKWRAEALTGLFKYDAIINSFTEENTESTVTFVAGLAGIKTPIRKVA